MDGGRDGGSVECAETPLFSIKGFGFPLLFIYSPAVIKETTGWNTADERKGSRTVKKERGEEEGGNEGGRAGGSEENEKKVYKGGSGGGSSQIWLMDAVFSTISSLVFSFSYFPSLSLSLLLLPHPSSSPSPSLLPLSSAGESVLLLSAH